MPSRLIINADDFGLTPGINRAIIELHKAGVLSSATLMANGPACEDAIALTHDNPGLRVGCHLVLTDGTPISPPHLIPTLLGADGVNFRASLFDFAQAATTDRIHPDHLACEAEAQIRKLQSAGIDVTHIDTHKHTHLFPSVARPIFSAAQRCGISKVRRPFEPRWSSTHARASLLRQLQLRVLETFAPSFDHLIRNSPTLVRTAAGTLGIAATGTLTSNVLRATFAALIKNSQAETYELCCHPGHPDAELKVQSTRLRISREIELHALLEVVPEILRSTGALEIIHYGYL